MKEIVLQRPLTLRWLLQWRVGVIPPAKKPAGFMTQWVKSMNLGFDRNRSHSPLESVYA